MKLPCLRKSRQGRAAVVLGWMSLGLAILLVIAVLALRSWVYAYLGGNAFQRLVDGKVSEFLQVEGGFAPLQVSGATIFSDGFRGEGRGGIQRINAEQLRAHLDLRAVLEREWRVDELTVERLDLTAQPALPGAAESQQERGPAASSPAAKGRGWLPSEFVLESLIVRELNASWGGGATPAVALTRSRAEIINGGENGWAIEGRSGKLRFGIMPEMSVERFGLRYRDEKLYLTEVRLQQGEEGTIVLSGETGDGVAIDAAIHNVPVSPYLPEDWRARLSGGLLGDVKVRTAPDGTTRMEGTLRIAAGELTGLPILDQIAEFTGTERFRRIALTDTEAKFTSLNGRTDVSRFLAESEGLLRVEGSFVLENDEIAGRFDVGVTPSSLQWLPGAQEKVFTTRRDGYVWTTMSVSGPIEHPREDLTPRLVAAAGGAVIEGVEDTMRDATRILLDMATPLFR